MTRLNQLSEREKDVVQQLLQGKSNKLIAIALGISTSTVEFHLKNVYTKFQVRSRVELILKLGESTGSVETEKPGYSTVANHDGNAEDGDSASSPMNWAGCFRAAVSLSCKELAVKKSETFYIANAILWAAAILVSAILGAPFILSVLLLPTLAVASLMATHAKLRA